MGMSIGTGQKTQTTWRFYQQNDRKCDLTTNCDDCRQNGKFTFRQSGVLCNRHALWAFEARLGVFGNFGQLLLLFVQVKLNFVNFWKFAKPIKLIKDGNFWLMDVLQKLPNP